MVPHQVTSNLAQLGYVILTSHISRSSQSVFNQYAKLEQDVARLHAEYEGELVTCADVMLGIVLDLITCPNQDIDQQFSEFWHDLNELDQKASQAKVSRR